MKHRKTYAQIILSPALAAMWHSVSIVQKKTDLVLEDIEEDQDKEAKEEVKEEKEANEAKEEKEGREEREVEEVEEVKEAKEAKEEPQSLSNENLQASKKEVSLTGLVTNLKKQ